MIDEHISYRVMCYQRIVCFYFIFIKFQTCVTLNVFWNENCGAVFKVIFLDEDRIHYYIAGFIF